MDGTVDLAALRRDIVEGTEYLVVGLIMPVKQRYAEYERAENARQAEDLARSAVAGEAVNGQRGELWVAGVVEVVDGRLSMADSYACFVDPDEERS